MRKLLEFIKNLFKKKQLYVSWMLPHVPSTNDVFFSFTEMFGATETLPQKVYMNKCRNQNQWAFERTLYACTCFGAAHWINEMAYNERWQELSRDDRRWKDLWEIALMRWAQANGGWTLNGGLELLREQNLITWYSTLTTVEEAKTALARWNIIAWGSSNIDWQTTELSKYLTPRSTEMWWWHMYVIVWYDDSLQSFIAKNSYSESWWNNGCFYIRYSDFWFLFQWKYVLHNNVDTPAFERQRKIMIGQRAKSLWLWNWERPDAIIKTTERDIVQKRIQDYLKKQWIKYSLAKYNKQTRLDAINTQYNILVAVMKANGKTI